MFLDLCDVGLDRCIERDALGSEYKLVEVLFVLRLDINSRANVLSNERVIENGQVWKGRGPRTVLEYQRGGGGRLNNNMGRVTRGKAAAFEDRSRVAITQGAEYCRERSLPASVFRIEQREFRERQLRAGVYRLEFADVSEKLNILNHRHRSTIINQPEIASIAN